MRSRPDQARINSSRACCDRLESWVGGLIRSVTPLRYDPISNTVLTDDHLHAGFDAWYAMDLDRLPLATERTPSGGSITVQLWEVAA